MVNERGHIFACNPATLKMPSTVGFVNSSIRDTLRWGAMAPWRRHTASGHQLVLASDGSSTSW